MEAKTWAKMCYFLLQRRYLPLDYILLLTSELLLIYFRLKKLRENCDKQFEAHWQCLDKNNHEFYMCRPEEKIFNGCVLNALVSDVHVSHYNASL